MSETLVRNDLTIYDQAAGDWWTGETRWVRALHKMVPARLRHFDKLVEWHDRHILDLGCAGGFMSEAMANKGALVTGIDPSAKAIAVARQHAQENGLSISYDIGVGEALPYVAENFDIVLCVDVLEHVDDLDVVIREVSRVLRPGGLFLFDTINRNALARFVTITMAEDVLRILPKGTHDHDKFIRPAELRRSLVREGFRPGRFVGLGPRGIDRHGDPVFGSLPLTSVLFMGHARRI